MRSWFLSLAVLASTLPGSSGNVSGANGEATIVLVVGAAGTESYGREFASWAGRWESTAAAGGARLLRVGAGAEDGSGQATDRDRLRALLEAQEPTSSAPLYLVYLGHGTFDGEQPRWNLRGPDVSAEELAAWLEDFTRPTAVVVCAASSGPFVNLLSRPGRTVVTATRSGDQYSFSRFGDYFSSAVGDLGADLDKDEQVSLLEAFLFASSRVAEFYAAEERLASEHALIDDNGDGLGTRADFFRGVRGVQVPEAGRLADGVLAHQMHLIPSARERALSPDLRQRRDALEAELEALRARRGELGEEAFLRALEPVLVELARLYGASEQDG